MGFHPETMKSVMPQRHMEDTHIEDVIMNFGHSFKPVNIDRLLFASP